MKKLRNKIEEKALKTYLNFRKGDVFIMVLGAALGAIILIAFYLYAKDGVDSWGSAFTELVKL